MSPEKPKAPCHTSRTDTMMGEGMQLDAIAAQLMAVQRHWNDPDRQCRLDAALDASRAAWHAIQGALAEGLIALPPDVQHNLLILSVYADSKIDACKITPGAETLGSLIALTRTLAGSLKDWRVAA